MSSWLSIEGFLHSATASYIRRFLVVFGIGGVGGDYYVTHMYEAFDPAEGEKYVIDWSPIGKPRCVMLLVPNNHYPNYSPWTPKNGDVVLARRVPDDPNWIQLINGRFVERQTCGVELCRRLEDVKKEEAQRMMDDAQAREFLKPRTIS